MLGPTATVDVVDVVDVVADEVVVVGPRDDGGAWAASCPDEHAPALMSRTTITSHLARNFMMARYPRASRFQTG
jgi:hypothetical protein